MRPKFNFAQRRLILEAYEEGMKQKDIAGVVKASQPTISRAIKDARYERCIEELSGRVFLIAGRLSDIGQFANEGHRRKLYRNV